MTVNFEHCCVAVAGQPNTGKSTVFSALTGLAQEVGNWPGKTVEKRMGRAPAAEGGYMVVDLPGGYSLQAQSPEEAIASGYLAEARPDLTVVVASALSPERTLAYALDAMSGDRAALLVLNMADMAEKNGVRIDANAVERALGVPVLLLSAVRRGDVGRLRVAVREALARPRRAVVDWASLAGLLPAPERAEYDNALRAAADATGMSGNDAAGLVWRVLLGGTGGGAEFPEPSPELRHAARTARYAWAQRLVGRSGEDALRNGSTTARWDAFLLHPLWGGLTMAAILLGALVAGFGVGFPLAHGMSELFKAAEPYIARVLGVDMPLLTAMSLGALKGVGAVFAMLPFIVVFHFVFAVLEDVGYMARAAFLMDRIMSAIGLDGRAFIPLLFSVPCNITGVVGARIIDSGRERLLTLLLVPLVPCTAKIVVTVSLSMWLFDWWAGLGVVLGLLAMNMAVLAACSIVFGRFLGPGDASRGLLMELPHFHAPNFRTIAGAVVRNARSFLHKASTLIVCFSVVLWFVAYYPGGTLEASLLGRFGKAIAPLGEWMGADWRLLTALLASGVSKEAVLATMGVLYDASGGQLAEALRASVTPAGGIAFMAAQSLFVPCVATLGILFSESRSWKVLAAILSYTLLLPLVMAVALYTVAGWFGW